MDIIIIIMQSLKDLAYKVFEKNPTLQFLSWMSSETLMITHSFFNKVKNHTISDQK